MYNIKKALATSAKLFSSFVMIEENRKNTLLLSEKRGKVVNPKLTSDESFLNQDVLDNSLLKSLEEGGYLWK